MRLRKLGALATLVLALGPAGPAVAQGILIQTHGEPATQDLRGCLVTARNALLGTGLVLESRPGFIAGSNEERTVSIRCDVPGFVLFIEAFFPGDRDRLDSIEAAFDAQKAAPLIASQSKGHQYETDCSRGTSCAIDPAAVCRQAYPASSKPSAKVLSQASCADGRGSYVCSVTYDLECQ